jgi:hypothetical protein
VLAAQDTKVPYRFILSWGDIRAGVIGMRALKIIIYSKFRDMERERARLTGMVVVQ